MSHYFSIGYKLNNNITINDLLTLEIIALSNHEEFTPSSLIIPGTTPNNQIPNLVQPFAISEKSDIVLGYYSPPTDREYVIAFHCIFDSRESSNYPLDTLQYFKFQALCVSYIENNNTTVLLHINDIDTYSEEQFQYNDGTYGPSTLGLNLAYNNYVFAFRGSVYITDYLKQVVPINLVVKNIDIANPAILLERFKPWLVNLASQIYKNIAADTNLIYSLTPFQDNGFYTR